MTVNHRPISWTDSLWREAPEQKQANQNCHNPTSEAGTTQASTPPRPGPEQLGHRSTPITPEGRDNPPSSAQPAPHPQPKDYRGKSPTPSQAVIPSQMAEPPYLCPGKPPEPRQNSTPPSTGPGEEPPSPTRCHLHGTRGTEVLLCCLCSLLLLTSSWYDPKVDSSIGYNWCWFYSFS